MGYNKAKINLPRPPLPFFFLGERAVLLALASRHAGQPWPLRNRETTSPQHTGPANVDADFLFYRMNIL